MENTRKFFSVKTKIYIFVVITVLSVAFGTSLIAFSLSVDQIDRYYRQSASDNARNMASQLDGDYLARLKAEAASDEFQELRARAEEEDNEQLIEDHLKEEGLWDQYIEIRHSLSQYIDNMEGVTYMYVVAHGDKDAEYDMYLIDDESTELYETGYYEEREEELRGKDIADLEEPTISNGDWGWLCSDFKPVYDSNGDCVCVVGCDFDMEEVMSERTSVLATLIFGSIIFTAIVLGIAVWFINNIIIRPIAVMTDEMKRFRPGEHKDYETAGVMSPDFRNDDEIGEIYHGIRNMQIDIIDYLDEKLKVESDIKHKEQRIDQLSNETNTDALTGVGSKSAYIKKSAEINRKIGKEKTEFAIVMVDMNNLKDINDAYGHKAGDLYITGCCDLICEVFKHSPVYRIGGDEFVVILQGPDYEERNELTAKLRAGFIESYAREDVDPWLRYSAAAGMAENASDDTTVEFVFKRADKAMYEDKQSFKKRFGGMIRD